MSERSRKWRALNPFRARFNAKKAHAKAEGIDFGLVFEDIPWPTFCPALGEPLAYEWGRGVSDWSPSFDRLNRLLGYVPGNVLIVSHKANSIKNNGTVEDLERVASFYRQLMK